MWRSEFNDESGFRDVLHLRDVSTLRSFIVEPLLFLHFVTYAPLSVLIPQFVYGRFNQDQQVALYGNISTEYECVNSSDHFYDGQMAAQVQSSYWMIYLTLALTVPALVAIPLIGGYSDVMGRKRGIIPAQCGCILKAFAYLICVYFHLPLYVLLVGHAIEGVLGSSQNILGACAGYLIDTLSDTTRQKRIFVLEMVAGLVSAGTIFGFQFIANFYGFFYSFLGIIIIQAIAILYTVFFVPEIIIPSNETKLFSCDIFIKAREIFRNLQQAGIVWKPLTWIILLFLYGAPLVIKGDLIILYLMNTPVCALPIVVGMFFSIAVCIMFVLGPLVSTIIQRCTKTRIEDAMAIIGVATGAAATFLVTYSYVGPIMLVIVPTSGFFSNVVGPIIQGQVMMSLPQDDASTIFILLQIFEPLSVMTCTVLYYGIYSVTVRSAPNVVFYVMTGLMLIAIAPISYFIVQKKREGSGNSVSTDKLEL